MSVLWCFGRWCHTCCCCLQKMKELRTKVKLEQKSLRIDNYCRALVRICNSWCTRDCFPCHPCELKLWLIRSCLYHSDWTRHWLGSASPVELIHSIGRSRKNRWKANLLVARVRLLLPFADLHKLESSILRPLQTSLTLRKINTHVQERLP